MTESSKHQIQRQYRYYEILEIAKNANQEEIKRAYLRLAKKYHPDVNSESGAHEKFKKINEAYEVLSDVTQRTSYDNSLAECPICWTHEVIHTVEEYWRCRHCGCRFNPYGVSEVIEEVGKYTIPGRRQHIKTIFQATQCSRCRKFYTQPFLCPPGRLQSNCISFNRLGDEERRHLMDDDKWWWRMADMIQQVQDKGIMGRCRECGALNPNPQKTVCWQCGKNTLCCPSCRESPILRYNIEKNFWKCSNAGCGKKFAIKPKKKSIEPTLTKEICSKCGNNLYYDSELLLWRCKKCKRIYTYDDLHKKQGPVREEESKQAKRTASNHEESDTTAERKETRARGISKKIQNWLIALLLIFSLSIIGIGISIFVGSFIPFWILFGFSFIYSIEKWFYYFTRRHKGLGKLYRFLLNLSILALLGLLVWSGIKLFSQQLVQSSLIGSLIFLTEFIFFIWMWRVVAKNSWRWPSMKLTMFSLVALFLVLAFAGVQPMSVYKDSILSKMSSSGSTATTTLLTPVPVPLTTSPPPSVTSATSTPPTTIAPTVPEKIDPKTGQYKNYYLGLVKNPEVEGGSGCYDSQEDFIVLINNKNAKNPTYSELVNFLQSNKTDEFPYQLSAMVNRFYYGEAEDIIDLGHIKEIIDGTTRPSPPQVCADFAERLHNDAEMAGIRCGYVIVNNLSHALDIFETTDRGLVSIDDTGRSNDLQAFTITLPNSITFGEPTSWDKVAYVAVGKPYGLIDLKSALSFGLDYSGYEKWLATKENLDTLETEYDKLTGGRTLVPEETYNQLQNILSQEKALSSELGGFWDSLGTVTSYYVTWDGNWKDRK